MGNWLSPSPSSSRVGWQKLINAPRDGNEVTLLHHLSLNMCNLTAGHGAAKVPDGYDIIWFNYYYQAIGHILTKSIVLKAFLVSFIIYLLSYESRLAYFKYIPFTKTPKSTCCHVPLPLHLIDIQECLCFSFLFDSKSLLTFLFFYLILM